MYNIFATQFPRSINKGQKISKETRMIRFGSVDAEPVFHKEVAKKYNGCNCISTRSMHVKGRVLFPTFVCVCVFFLTF